MCSSNKELFNKVKPHYESALKQSRRDEKLTYTECKKPKTQNAQNSHKNRQRNVIWFNPPYNMSVQTNIGRVSEPRQQTFPKNHKYKKIFNKNNIKISYSCTDNLQTIMKNHRDQQDTPNGNNCNCRKKNMTTLWKTTDLLEVSSSTPT